MLGHEGGLLQIYSKAVDEYRRDAIRKLEEFKEDASPAVEPTPTIYPN